MQSREVALNAESPRFFRVASRSLAIRSCDEGALIFDEQSGKTSLVNPQAAHLLRVLSAGPDQAENDLRIALGSDAIDGPDAMNAAPDAETFSALLASLESAGLIVPC